MNSAEATEQLARRLIQVASGPSPCEGERRVMDVFEAWARKAFAPGAGALQIYSRPVSADRWKRRNLLLVLPGTGSRRVLFAAHLDTVGASDFGKLESIARNPDALSRQRRVGRGWLPGRGALDMKSGAAAAAAALLCLSRTPLKNRGGDVGLLLTVDEEVLSAGVRACAGWAPLALRKWSAVISTDFTDPPSRGFHGRLHVGTVGKLLVGVRLRTRARHAGAISPAPDAANWGARLILRASQLRAGKMAPPAVLRARDNKTVYDTQVPDEFQLYWNVLGEKLDPAKTLSWMLLEIRSAWRDLSPRGRLPEIRIHSSGPAGGSRSTEAPWEEAEARMRRNPGDAPSAAVFFAPPYYAARTAAGAESLRRIRAVARRNGLEPSGCYPFISDLSFFGPKEDSASREFQRACPVRAGAAGIGLSAPVVTLGPWGRGAHGPAEAVWRDYAFGRLPGILQDCVREIWK